MKKILAAAAFLVFVVTSSAQATTFTFTSSAAFAAALAGSNVSTEGYETYAINSLIANGSTVNGITYSFPVGTDGRIDNLYNRNGNASLALQRGADNTAFFLPGDSFTATFAAPVRAVGIFFNVGVSPAGSLTVSTSVGSAGNGAAYDTGTLYFVGLLSDSATFTSATFAGSLAISSGFNVDDLRTAAVPEPATLALFGTGLVAAARRFRSRRA